MTFGRVSLGNISQSTTAMNSSMGSDRSEIFFRRIKHMPKRVKKMAAAR